MTNTNVTPNCVHLNMGLCGTAYFGPLHHITPVHYTGQGHTDLVKVTFTYGLSLGLTRDTAIALHAQLPDAIHRLPQPPDMSGIAYLGEHP